MNKLLDDAKDAGFYVDINGIITVGAGVWKNTRNKPLNEKLAKFAALQIHEGYHLVQNEDSKNENLEIPTLDKMREIFARYPNKNMQSVTFDADLYKLVPIEPTKEMLQAFSACKSWLDSNDGARYKLLSSYNGDMGEPYYKAMLSASPPTNIEDI